MWLSLGRTGFVRYCAIPQSTGFLCCFETIHHCKALASFVALILINAKYWLPLPLWNYSSLQSSGFVVKSCSSSESKAFCIFCSSPQSTTLAVCLFFVCLHAALHLGSLAFFGIIPCLGTIDFLWSSSSNGSFGFVQCSSLAGTCCCCFLFL